MPSFGVSATSPKNSLLFNMSPTSAIIFIKCPNRCHMKNNIRYEGNTNNTSVIIFLKSKVKNSQRWFSAWENLRGGFRDVGCHFWYSFHFCIFISFLIFILLSFFICRFSSFTFLFNIITHLSVDYRRVFTLILYFQPSPSQSDSCSFSTIPLSSCYGFEWAFFTHRRFLP